MAAQKSIDSKREKFRKYLEGAGVIDKLTGVLNQILHSDDKPEDPLQFISDALIRSSPVNIELAHTQQYLDSARERIAALEAENEQLKVEVETLRKTHTGPGIIL